MTYSEGSRVWAVRDLWRAAVNLTPFEQPIDALPDIESIDRGDIWDDGTPTGLEEVFLHIARIEGADLAYPIILTPEGHVCDGAHRIWKARKLGLTHILAVRLPVMPALGGTSAPGDAPGRPASPC